MNYISDGFTESAFLKGVARLYDDVRFSYRPLLIDERSEFLDCTGKLSPAQRERETAKLMAGKLVSWDVTDRNGNALPANADNLLRLRPVLFQRLSFVVLGIEAPDEDPNGTPEEQAERQRLVEQAKQEHRPYGDV